MSDDSEGMIRFMKKCKMQKKTASLDHHYTEKDSPQPQVPLILGLLKTNSDASLGKK